ncbi:hypothetical protein DL93DRAFT_2156604 [Clavulina sp. PMI_390]|nr:hypothetical protein DL93DRAFT_2156604 [Clavulina sp. PMI_390]
MSTSSSFILPASFDNFPLAAQCYEPSDQPVLACVVISCATGITARFYRSFAHWLSCQGIAVLTYDFRYMGLSWPPHVLPLITGPLSTPETRTKALQNVPDDVRITSHWAERDTTAAVRFASDRWRAVPLTLLGHSLGGMILPLSYHTRHLVTRYLNVAGGNIWVGSFHRPNELRARLQKLLYDDIDSQRILFTSRMDLGENLPAAPGREWLDYIISARGVQHTHHAAALTKEIDRPYLFIGFDDDWHCSKERLENHMAQLCHSDGLKASLWISPSTQNPPWAPCEHVRSFIPVMNTHGETQYQHRDDTIWLVYRDWILNETADRTLGDFRQWTPEDEYDPLERSASVYSWDTHEPVARRTPTSNTSTEVQARL